MSTQTAFNIKTATIMAHSDKIGKLNKRYVRNIEVITKSDEDIIACNEAIRILSINPNNTTQTTIDNISSAMEEVKQTIKDNNERMFENSTTHDKMLGEIKTTVELVKNNEVENERLEFIYEELDEDDDYNSLCHKHLYIDVSDINRDDYTWEVIPKKHHEDYVWGIITNLQKQCRELTTEKNHLFTQFKTIKHMLNDVHTNEECHLLEVTQKNILSALEQKKQTTIEELKNNASITVKKELKIAHLEFLTMNNKALVEENEMITKKIKEHTDAIVKLSIE